MAKYYQNLIEGRQHICHTASQKICRGGRNYQIEIFYRMGLLDQPSNEAFEAAVQQQEE